MQKFRLASKNIKTIGGITMKRISVLLISLLLVFSLFSCELIEPFSEPKESSPGQVSIIDEKSKAEGSEEEPETAVDENGSYYDLEHVVVYLSLYKKLPNNYIKKSEAQALGWQGGSVEKYKPGAAIGGDYYGNYEKLLPVSKGVKYTECDLETNGSKPRGEKRLIYSSDWHFYYTEDHYESFREVVYENGKVVFK